MDSGGSKILVVDDFPTSRRLLAHRLKHNYTVIEAASGQAAIDLAAEHKPDMILLDIEMPGMDGFQTLEILRESVIEKAVPVIFLTARTDSESRQRGLASGAVDFLTKPYDKEELWIKVENHLALYEARKEIQQANIKMAEELKMASDLQRSLLPTEFPDVATVKFSAVFLPTSEASGDIYDVLELPGGGIAFAQADVSGHGVRSAMIGAMFKIGLQAISAAGLSPSQFYARLNEDMVAVTPDSDFLTVFAGIIDTDSLELVYSNAGHPNPLLYRNSTKDVTLLHDGGFMIGAFPGMDFDEGTEKLEPGDKILVYTDGVTEAPDRDLGLDLLYGTERLRELFVKHSARGPDEILAEIVADLEAFQGRSNFDDDVSLLLIAIQ